MSHSAVAFRYKNLLKEKEGSLLPAVFEALYSDYTTFHQIYELNTFESVNFVLSAAHTTHHDFSQVQLFYSISSLQWPCN